SAAIVLKRIVQNDHKDALIHAYVNRRLHKPKLKTCRESNRSLACLFFQICECLRAHERPRNWTIRTGAEDLNTELISVTFNLTLCNSTRLAVCVGPTAKQLLRICRGRGIQQRRIEMTSLFELKHFCRR